MTNYRAYFTLVGSGFTALIFIIGVFILLVKKFKKFRKARANLQEDRLGVRLFAIQLFKWN